MVTYQYYINSACWVQKLKTKSYAITKTKAHFLVLPVTHKTTAASCLQTEAQLWLYSVQQHSLLCDFDLVSEKSKVLFWGFFTEEMIQDVG